MPDTWAKVDFFSRIFLGFAGFALSLVLAIDQVHQRYLEKTDAESELLRKNNQDIQNRADALKHEYEFYYSFVHQSRKIDEVRTDLDLASSFAQTLSLPPYRQNAYNDAIVTLREKLDPQSARKALVGQTVDLQRRETATDDGTIATNPKWFAVVGSYTISSAGLLLARQQAKSITGQPCAEVWKTSQSSNNYAVILGGAMTRVDALVISQRARDAGRFPDAFSQADRGWKLVVPCQ